MHLLAFDTCFDACSVAVAARRHGTIVTLSARFERFETGHAERLIPMIGEAMDEAALSFDAITRIAVTVGPGTFTGTRIGIAAARALAMATGADTVGVSSLAVMAAVARREFRHELLAVVVDARRGEVYAQIFEPGEAGEAAAPPRLLSLAEAARLGGNRRITFVGSAAEAVAALATADDRNVQAALPELLPDAVALAHIGAELPASAAPLVPFYLRPPDAKPQAGKAVARA